MLTLYWNRLFLIKIFFTANSAHYCTTCLNHCSLFLVLPKLWCSGVHVMYVYLSISFIFGENRKKTSKRCKDLQLCIFFRSDKARLRDFTPSTVLIWGTIVLRGLGQKCSQVLRMLNQHCWCKLGDCSGGWWYVCFFVIYDARNLGQVILKALVECLSHLFQIYHHRKWKEI